MYVLESFQTHHHHLPPPPLVEKLPSTKPLSGAKNLGDCFSMHCDLLMYLILDFMLRTILFMENMNWIEYPNSELVCL